MSGGDYQLREHHEEREREPHQMLRESLFLSNLEKMLMTGRKRVIKELLGKCAVRKPWKREF